MVAHAISVTVLQARGARRMLGRDEEEVRRALDAIEHTNTQALGDMRRLLAVLRDTEGDAADRSRSRRLARLDELVEDVRGSGLPVEVEHGRRQPRRAAGRGPVGVPDRPGGADQRAQARGAATGHGSS